MSVIRVRRRAPVVDALLYDGGFDLGFLTAGEQVGSAADDSGAVVVIEGGKVKIRAELGTFLVRDPDGGLASYTPDEFAATFDEEGAA